VSEFGQQAGQAGKSAISMQEQWTVVDDSSMMMAQLHTYRLLIAYRFVVGATRMKGQMWSMQEVIRCKGHMPW